MFANQTNGFSQMNNLIHLEYELPLIILEVPKWKSFYFLQEFELELEDYGSPDTDESVSEYCQTDNDDATANYATARTSEIFRITDPTYNSNTRQNTREELIAKQDEYLASRQLTFTGKLLDIYVKWGLFICSVTFIFRGNQFPMFMWRLRILIKYMYGKIRRKHNSTCLKTYNPRTR